MKKQIKTSLTPYRNTFNQTAYDANEVFEYIVSKDEFFNLLGNEKEIVNIKRDEKSEFLFEDQPEWLVNDSTKYAILNLEFGLKNISFARCLDRNDTVNSVLKFK